MKIACYPKLFDTIVYKNENYFALLLSFIQLLLFLSYGTFNFYFYITSFNFYFYSIASIKYLMLWINKT